MQLRFVPVLTLLLSSLHVCYYYYYLLLSHNWYKDACVSSCFKTSIIFLNGILKYVCACVCLYIVHGNLHNEKCVPWHSISKKPVAFAVNSCHCCELYICVRFANSLRVMKCVVCNLAC